MCDSLIISLFFIHLFTSLLLIIGFSWWNESVLDISDNIASIYLWYAFSLSICIVNMHMQFSCICTLLCVCAFNKHLHTYAIINWYFYAYAFIYNITSTHWYNMKNSLVDIGQFHWMLLSLEECSMVKARKTDWLDSCKS